MPTYEYACKSCGEHLEVAQSFTDEALTTCPACGGQLRKVFGSIGISFKGSGFYRTDSRPAATKKDQEQEKAKEGAGDKAGAKAGAGVKDGAAAAGTDTSSKSGSSSTSDTSTPKTDSSSKSGSPSSKPGGDKAGAAAATS